MIWLSVPMPLFQEGIDFHNSNMSLLTNSINFESNKRAFFKQFGSPHILQMSATPIPRSMAIAFFGEFDVSIIDELPKGRLPIKTKIISTTETKRLKPRILDNIYKKIRKFSLLLLWLKKVRHWKMFNLVLVEFESIQTSFPELKGKNLTPPWENESKRERRSHAWFQNLKNHDPCFYYGYWGWSRYSRK